MLQRLLLIAGLLLTVAAAGFLFYVKFVLVPRAQIEESAASPLNSVRDPLWETPDFELLNCDGKTIAKADLAGKVWIGAFIFTRCPGPCPLITRRMIQVQEALNGLPDFRLVSFTVDPAYDSPETLHDYALQQGARLNNWFFLTSRDSSDETMHRIAHEFKIAAARRAAEESTEVPDIVHGTNILLVDRQGRVRGVYDSEDPQTSQLLAAGALQLLAEKAM